MLSFDVTDKQIKIVKGVQKGGRISISQTAIVDVPEGVVVNGYINDIARLATFVNDRLREKRMYDKEAVLSISSNQIVFKELSIPKTKSSEIYTMVQNQMHHNMNISSDYSISYTIVGEVQEEKNHFYKILAEACPFEMVNNFKKLFNMLSIQLKNVIASANCISRVILQDNKNKDRMPLLAIQIDDNYLNLSLYDNNQLSFARFVTIDKEDYDSSDYVMEALSENVFQMIQFCKAHGGKGISDIMFYGEVRDYIKYTKILEQQDVKTHILSVPTILSGYENFEFTAFANAIGAMYKRKKETERVNLLDVDTTVSRDVDSSFLVSAVGVFVACAVVVGGTFGYFKFKIDGVNKEKDEIYSYINSSEVQEKLAEVSRLEGILTKVQVYKTGAENANVALASHPKLTSEVFDVLWECAEDKSAYNEIAFDEGEGYIHLSVVTVDKAYPADLIENLLNANYFEAVAYEGFSKETITTKDSFGRDQEEDFFVYSVSVKVKAGDTNED